MNRRFGITPKLTLIFVLFAAVLLAGVSLLAYENGRQGLEAATFSELQSTAIEKQAALNAWVDEGQADVARLAGLPSRVELIGAFLAATPGTPTAQTAHDVLINELKAYRASSANLTDILIMDPNTAQVMASTNPADEGQFKEDQSFFIHGRDGLYVQNVYFSLALQGPAMTAAAPVHAADGRLLAVLAGQMNLAEMNAIIQRRTGLHQTDDAFLVNTANQFVTQPHLLTDPVVLQRGIHTPAVADCLAGASGVLQALDYRSVPAFIAYTWLPERNLCLIVKIDRAEAQAPVRQFGLLLAGLGGLALLLASAVAVWLARTVTRPVLALQAGAARIAHGDLAARLPEGAHDELGALAREFNRMAAALSDQAVQLRAYAAELEHRVEARTAELRQSEERFRLVIEASPNALILVNQAGQISFVNQPAVSLFGYARGELLDQPAELLVPERFRLDHPALRATFAASPQPRPMGRGQALFARRKDGAEVPVEIGLSPVQIGDGLSTLATITDITERKRAEETLARQAEDLQRSNAELEQFAYVASHDLQEPLRMVSSFMQLLAQRYQGRLDADADEFIGYAVDGANRMKGLIGDLLAYSRVGTRGKEFARTECEAVLQQTLDNLQLIIEETQATVTHAPLPAVRADGAQLLQLFQNLIGNALKFHGAQPPCVQIGAAARDGEWLFSVADNGIGLDMQYAERIFVIFQRLHSKEAFPGTGIGLAICKKIVERHGGRLWVESQPGQGATFYFTLPRIGGSGSKEAST